MKVDIQQQITDKMIALIESGETQPWRCPWVKTGVDSLPINWSTKSQYRGLNILILWNETIECGYTRNAWLTFNQARHLGGKVRKGEKSVECIYYSPVTVKGNTKGRSDDDDDEEKTFWLSKSFNLFNVEQVDGLEELPHGGGDRFGELDPFAEINQLALRYCDNTGLSIKRQGDRAYYSPSQDLVNLPTTFEDRGGYAATLSHELIHSTGHHERLDRFNSCSGTFGYDEERAFEELIAELGAAFTCAKIGIEGQHESHASYLSSWLGVFKKDKTYLVRAAAAANKAFQYLMAKSATQLHIENTEQNCKVA
jgi:antirestriction protein ArdC